MVSLSGRKHHTEQRNVLCGIADFSTQSEQPVTKQLVVEVPRARSKGIEESL